MKYIDYVSLWRYYLLEYEAFEDYLSSKKLPHMIIVYKYVDQAGGLPIAAYTRKKIWEYAGGTAELVVIYDRKSVVDIPSGWIRRSRGLLPPADVKLSKLNYKRGLNKLMSEHGEGIVYWMAGLQAFRLEPEVLEFFKNQKSKFPKWLFLVEHGDIGLVRMKEEEWEAFIEPFDFVSFASPCKYYHCRNRYKFKPKNKKYFSLFLVPLKFESEFVPFSERKILNTWLSGIFAWRHPFDWYNFVDEKYTSYLKIMSHQRRSFSRNFKPLGVKYYDEAKRRFPEWFGNRKNAGATYTTPDKFSYAEWRSILWKASSDGTPGTWLDDTTPLEAICSGTLVVSNYRFASNPLWKFDGENNVLFEMDSVTAFEAFLDDLLTNPKPYEDWARYVWGRYSYQIVRGTLTAYLIFTLYEAWKSNKLDEYKLFLEDDEVFPLFEKDIEASLKIMRGGEI